MDSKFIRIDHKKYREISQCGPSFERSKEFDDQYGIRFIYEGNDKHDEHLYTFLMEIVDEKRFMFAKIKFGI